MCAPAVAAWVMINYRWRANFVEKKDKINEAQPAEEEEINYSVTQSII